MNYDEIKKLINEMGAANVDELKIEFPEGIKISMKKNTNTVRQNENILQTITQTSNQEDYKLIKSPMVGTFYNSSSPENKSFVKVGDYVKKGQVVCIIEAMKLMNEIESEYDGEIIEICVKNEDIVEYGMPLFKVK